MDNQKLAIALCPGSEEGVGPELLVKALEHENFTGIYFHWCGDRKSFELAANRAQFIEPYIDKQKVKIGQNLIQIGPDLKEANPKKRQALFLQQSILLSKNSQINAIVTGPIEKEALAFIPGGPWPGQTEFFARHLGLSGAQKPMMTFLGAPFILGLATTHVPLSKVPSLITKESMLKKITALVEAGAQALNKKAENFTLAVLGLNPHAGEGGLLGQEELDEISPAIKSAQEQGLKVFGPFASDGFFAYFDQIKPQPDGILAIYHDQGLIPYKMLAKGAAVNATLGLKIPRTSPAHGTAHELAGKNKACPKSTINAIKWAVKLAT